MQTLVAISANEPLVTNVRAPLPTHAVAPSIKPYPPINQRITSQAMLNQFKVLAAAKT
jgi:hypothetical protein